MVDKEAIEERPCSREGCGRSFVVHLTKAGKPRRGQALFYCSRSCARIVGNAIQAEQSRGAYEADPVMCPCGEPIGYERRHRAKYHLECRTKFQSKKKPNLEHFVTFTCGTCGDLVTKRKRKAQEWKFCSNACAAKHTKKVKHYVVRESDMVLDSTWECLFVGVCGFLKITIERVHRAESRDNNGRVYAPDFYIPTADLYIETKGWENGSQDRSQYPEVVVVDHQLMDRFRKAESAKIALRVLEVPSCLSAEISNTRGEGVEAN